MGSKPAARRVRFLVRGLALSAAWTAPFFAGCYRSLDTSTITCTVGNPGSCPPPYVCRGPGPKGRCCNPADPICGDADASPLSDPFQAAGIDASQGRSSEVNRDTPPVTNPDSPAIDAPGSGSVIGTGGVTTTGGGLGSGGIVGSGGMLGAGGHVGTGGIAGTGGLIGAGGQVATGGNPATGGTSTTRGTVPAGGTPATGGTSTTGGTVPAGGTPATGGTSTTGGTVTAGGIPATGGTSTTGGTVATGGVKGTGGTISAGGTAAGTGGATSGGNSGAGGSTPSCAVSPVDPSATAQARNLLCYLYSIYGNHVLSGQQEANWNDNPTNVSWYASNGMKTPAILGSDFAYHSTSGCTDVNISTTHAIEHWKAGGLVMYHYQMGLPGAGLTCANDCYTGTNCSQSTPPGNFFTNVITAGTPENTSLNAKLDYVAVQIKAMQDASMPVILALLDEPQSNGWYWWSKGSAVEFILLYNYAYGYLMNTKGLHNIIRLMPYSGSPIPDFWPGNAAVDIAGGDTYGTNPPFVLLFGKLQGIAGSTMPIALHETGAVPQPSTMFPSMAPWVLWNVWAGFETSNNSLANMVSAYADPHTITRDEVPNLK